VSEGPYYVTKGHSGIVGASGGVNTDENLNVLNEQNKTIKNLYATGNNVSGISIAAYQNVEGVGLGFSLTSGRLAGAAAAENAGYTTTEDTTELTETGKETMKTATERGMDGNLEH
jgi:predicted oxidoreductase